MKPRIGVLTSGGDCPGLNAVLRGVVLAADKLGWEVIGFKDGFEGLLLPEHYMVLDRARSSGIMPLGGTILGTTNRGHFVAKVGSGNRAVVPTQIIEQSREVLNRLQVKALIIVGGDGSMSTALQLQEAGINCIGVPKTATSHKRVMVLEVMGRHAGWIALHGGIAGGADAILIPEIPFSYDKLADFIKRRDAAGSLSSLVVAAEGATPHDGQQVLHRTGAGEYRFGGIGEVVAQELAARTGKETRCCVLGHLQRGGAPTTLDRILGTRFGVKAVQLANEGHFGSMVSYQNYQVQHVSIAEAVNRLRLVQPTSQMVETARDVEISFGD
jgi:6-phosphofructokinase 1